MSPKAVIFGCAGLRLNDEERAFFTREQPLGFILFARNVETPDQIKALVKDLRATNQDKRCPILIDQEGGRVQRLKPPQWRAAPPAATFGRIYHRDPDRALRLCFLNAALIGAELSDLGISVDCLPLLDVTVPGGHDVIGDRAFAQDPETVTALGRAARDGLMATGVQAIMKHIPGHGRALVDSHHDLPRVSQSLSELAASDFAPFRALADTPWAMTAHVVYEALDDKAPATLSEKVIHEVVRGEIGFSGLLVSDDLSMEALSGTLAERTARSLAAGCDVVLHCNGKFSEMRQVAEAADALTPDALDSLRRGQETLQAATRPLDVAALRSEFERISADLGGV